MNTAAYIRLLIDSQSTNDSRALADYIEAVQENAPDTTTVMHLQEKYGLDNALVWYEALSTGTESDRYYRCRAKVEYDFEGDTAFIFVDDETITAGFFHTQSAGLRDINNQKFDNIDDAAAYLLAILITHGAIHE